MTATRARGLWLPLAIVLSIVVTSFTTSFAMGAGAISGRVFDDRMGDGLLDGAIGGGSNPAVAGALVHIFHDDGSIPGSPDATDSEIMGSPFTTAADGTFSASSLADGDYWVAVDSTSFGPAGTWSEQTWGPNATPAPSATTVPTGPRYGGERPAVSDALATVGLPGAEHLAFVALSGAAVGGFDFGFSFNVVTRTGAGGTEDDHADPGRTVQGSLRQFLVNANTMPGANLMRFVPMTAPNAADAGPIHQIIVTDPLPAITGDDTTIDGTTYGPTGAVLDPNPGALSSPAASIGVSGLAAPSTARPDLVLTGNGVGVGLAVNGAEDVTIRKLGLLGFSTVAVALTDSEDALVEDNVIGAAADPGSGFRNGIGIEITDGEEGTIDGNTIANNGSVGINVPTGADEWTITGNDINGNGIENGWADQVRLVGGDDFTIAGNHIRNGYQIGIEIRVAVRSVSVDNNTIEGNGAGGNELAGIRNINELAQAMTVSGNVITGNAGPGVLISRDGASVGAPSLMTITGNRFGGNGGLAIDLTTSEAGRIAGDGPNPLSGNGCGTGTEANAGVDRPVLSAAAAPGPYLRVTGTGCPGTTVEFYTALADATDTFATIAYGEPITSLGTAVVAGDGTIDAFLAAGPVPGDSITALATDGAGNTSEPAANVIVGTANIPIITRLGADPFLVEAGGPYADPGATATDIEDGDLTGVIDTDDSVDPWTLGSYVVSYDVTDSDGFPAVSVTRSVQVADTTSPIITVIGPTFLTLEGGTGYVDQGATATDAFDGDLTSAVTTTGVVDPFVLGVQVIDYSVSDSSGNGASATRTVSVVDTTRPSLTVNGSLNQVVTQNSTYVDSGATATDLVDGDLTASIVVTGAVDTSTRGIYQLRFDVSDASGNAAPTVIRTVVVADPNPPVITITGPSTVTVEALAGYIDAGATATDTEDGSLTGAIVTTNQVNPDVPGTYTVRYRVTDRSGNTATATRTVRVVDTTPPVITLLGDDPVLVPAGHAYVEPGATATDAVDGTVPVSVTGTVDTAAPATLTLTYTATDAAGNSTTAVRTVEVLPNHPPTVTGESYSLDQGERLSIAAPGLLANDVDPEGDVLVASLVTVPVDGVVTIDPNGGFTYRHSDVRDPADSFTYQVRDAYGNVTVATVTISVTLDNRSPIAAADTATTAEDTPVVVRPLANDTDPDGDPLRLVSVSGAGNGLAAISGGQITYTPPADWSGTVSLVYSVSDGHITVSGTIAITVTAVNDSPVVVGDHYTTQSWDPLSLDVLRNDHDPEGHAFTIVAVSAAEHGTVRLVDDRIEYRPAIGYWGSDRFTYTVADELGARAEGTVTVLIRRPEWVEAAVLDGGASLLAAGPTGPRPDPVAASAFPPAEVVILFVGAFLQRLLAQSVHLALLLLSLMWFVLFGYSQWRRAAAKGKRYAVVLLDREDRLPVHATPGGEEITERLDAAERRIISNGRPHKVDGISWVPIETKSGSGWVDGAYLTEDAARSTFERDVTHRDMVRSLQAMLSEGRRPAVSPRGALDPVTLRRLGARALPMTAAEADQIAGLLADPGAEILVDELHAPDSLRPAQLRNFHWITVVADETAWHLFFEYHRNAPSLVAVRPEGAPLPRLV